MCLSTAGISLLSSIVLAEPQLSPPADAPRVIRYVSSLPAHQGQSCYGLVTSDNNGIPAQVRLLSDYNPKLCHTVDDPGNLQPQRLRWAFEAADAIALRGENNDTGDAISESLEQDRLAEVVLPPVAISIAELDSLQRVVIGAGINYAEHRDEVGVDTAGELLLFPKPVQPTGAYAPVRAGMQIGEARPVLLLDYEVELGLVLLDAIDLRHPPADYAAFINSVAFFVANDVSDREPIILDDETGYTRAKSHPTYLPTGPWMIHGRHLQPRTLSEGKHSQEIGLSVYETSRLADGGNAEVRQLSRSDAMLRGPWAIIKHMSDRFLSGAIICMRDARGQPRYLHNAVGVIPAGSIILTGTPGGTAIRKPGLWQKAELLVRGGFSLEGARQVFVEDSEQNVADSDYLHIGDRVESWVEFLGRQRWSVVADPEHKPYGVDGTGACESDSRPQPVSHK